jgi:integrase
LIHVRQRVDKFGTWGDPKSEKGERDVPVSPYVVNTLRGWRARCLQSDLNLVFPGRGGEVEVIHRIDWRFRTLKQKLKLTFRWHDLRHFAVSTWIEAGFAPKACQTFAGHANIAMTMDVYGHLVPSPEHLSGMQRASDMFLAAKPAAVG